MKLGIQILAFREANRIVPAIEQYYDIADRIVVAVSLKPWHSNLEPDNTASLAKGTQAAVYTGEWETETDQRNFTLERMEDMDFILIAPPDRFYTKEDLALIRLFVDNQAEKGVYGLYSLNYWKNFNTVIWPTYDLPAALFSRKTDDGNYAHFRYANELDSGHTHRGYLPGVMSHHISWIKTDKEMLEKIQSYTHAGEVLDGWYENCWLSWTPDMTSFGITKRGDFRYTVNYPLPQEIIDKLDPEWVKEINGSSTTK